MKKLECMRTCCLALDLGRIQDDAGRRIFLPECQRHFFSPSKSTRQDVQNEWRCSLSTCRIYLTLFQSTRKNLSARSFSKGASLVKNRRNLFSIVRLLGLTIDHDLISSSVVPGFKRVRTFLKTVYDDKPIYKRMYLSLRLKRSTKNCFPTQFFPACLLPVQQFLVPW